MENIQGILNDKVFAILEQGVDRRGSIRYVEVSPRYCKKIVALPSLIQNG